MGKTREQQLRAFYKLIDEQNHKRIVKVMEVEQDDLGGESEVFGPVELMKEYYGFGGDDDV